jgi:flagellin
MTISSLTNTSSIDAQRQSQKQQATVTDSMQKSTSGSKLNKARNDVASYTLSKGLESNIAASKAVIGNMNDGESMIDVVISSYGKIQDKLIRLKQLATTASGNLSNQQLSQLDIEFQKGLNFITDTANRTVYNNQELLKGGASTVSAYANAVAASGAGLIDVTAAPYNSADTFAAAPFVAGNAVGNITGQITNVDVNGVTGNYHVKVLVGNRTFEAKGVNETALGAAGVLNLVAEDGSRFGLTLGAGVGGLNTAANFETSLKNVFNMSSGGAAATLNSAITAANNGADAAQVSVIGSVTAGDYVVWSLAGSNELKMSNGSQTWTTKVSADGAQTARFDNGVSIALAAGFARNTAITNIGFRVNQTANNAMTISLQSGIRSTDVVTQEIGGSTATTLKIDTLNIKSQATAKAAGDAIDEALKTMLNYIASVSAFQGNLADTKSSLENTIDVSKSAFARLNDADILEELGIQSQGMVATQIAIAVNSKALELTQYLLQAVRS